MNVEICKIETKVNGNISIKWIYKYRMGNKKFQRVCKNCNSFEEAKEYVNKLTFLKDNPYLIKNIAAQMYLPGSEHMLRLEKFGKKITEETRLQKRFFLDLIVKKFGDSDISKIKVSEIEKYLLQDSHSGSWKNFFLETFGKIYDETIWVCKNPVVKPVFQKFARNSRKADIFTEDELITMFSNYELWDSYDEYLLFYTIYTCGLRLGEARALQVNQFIFDENILIVNGFCKKNGVRTNYCKAGSDEDKKYRCIPLSSSLVTKIRIYINNKNLSELDFLFTDSKGRIFSGDHLRIVFKHVLKKCNIDFSKRKLSPHSLRFTYVTRMRNILSIDDVRKIVGHNSMKMTEYYTRNQSIQEMIESSKKIICAVNQLYE